MYIYIYIYVYIYIYLYKYGIFCITTYCNAFGLGRLESTSKTDTVIEPDEINNSRLQYRKSSDVIEIKWFHNEYKVSQRNTFTGHVCM